MGAFALTIDWRLHLEGCDLPLEIAHDLALAIERLLAGAEIEHELLALQPGFLARVTDRDVRLLQGIFRAPQLELGNHAALEHLAVDLDLARRGLAIDLGLRDQLLRVGAAVLDIKSRTADTGVEAGERRLLLEQLAAELGTRDRRELLVLGDLVAGANMEVDRAGGDRVERGAVRGDDATVGDDITDQRALLDPRDPDPRAID